MELYDELATLDATMRGYAGHAQHAVADIILYNLAIDVREQAGAVRAVLDSPFPRAGLANARASFEGMLDAAYLVSDPSAYDERGALLRVFELFETERIQRRAELITVRTPGASVDLRGGLPD